MAYTGDCYTLLADENAAASTLPERRDAFRAHLVLNVIFNGSITFSDNQLLCSGNLRALVRGDDLVRTLYRQGVFGMAIRTDADDAPDRPIALSRLHAAFLRENKISDPALLAEAPDELAFIERYSRRRLWRYDVVRGNYTRNCERILFEKFGELLGGAAHDRLREIVEAGKDEDGGLGRAFLQNRLPGILRDAGIATSPEHQKLVRDCTDAPYVSNLPQVIGLNPIYAQEHRSSFDLFRGSIARVEDAAPPSTERALTSPDFFVHGLNALTLDDLDHLHHSDERRAYVALQEGGVVAGAFADLTEAYKALIRRLEMRIIERCGAPRTPEPPPRRFRQQHVTMLNRSAAAGVDLMALAVSQHILADVVHAAAAAITSLPVMNSATTALFELLEKRIDRRDARDAAARAAAHDADRHALGRMLSGQGRDECIGLQERPIEGQPFSKEVILT